MSSGVAEKEFEEDEDGESATGVCKTFLRENTVGDMLGNRRVECMSGKKICCEC